jgi:hypothetical protein
MSARASCRAPGSGAEWTIAAKKRSAAWPQPTRIKQPRIDANERELAGSAVASLRRSEPFRVNSCPFVVRKSSQKNKIPSYSSTKNAKKADRLGVPYRSRCRRAKYLCLGIHALVGRLGQAPLKLPTRRSPTYRAIGTRTRAAPDPGALQTIRGRLILVGCGHAALRFFAAILRRPRMRPLGRPPHQTLTSRRFAEGPRTTHLSLSRAEP